MTKNKIPRPAKTFPPKGRKIKTLADLKNHPWVESVHTEFDGFREDDRAAYWVSLHEGFICESAECGTIHEGTVKECCYMFNEFVKPGVSSGAEGEYLPAIIATKK